MVRDVLGSLLLLGGALWLWLGLVQAQRRQLRLLEELAASLEQMASAIRFRRETLLRLLAVAVCGAAALAAVRGVREVWAFLEDLLAAVEISSTLFLPLLKTAGIAVVTRIGADLCRDAGESAVASAVEMAGAMGALLAVLPLMQAAWEVLRSLL